MFDYIIECNLAHRYANFSPSTNGWRSCLFLDSNNHRHVRHYINNLWKRSLNLWRLYLRHNIGQCYSIVIPYLVWTICWNFIWNNQFVHWAEFKNRHSHCDSYAKSTEVSIYQTGASLVYSYDLGLYCHCSLDCRQLRLSDSIVLHARQ